MFFKILLFSQTKLMWFNRNFAAQKMLVPKSEKNNVLFLFQVRTILNRWINLYERMTTEVSKNKTMWKTSSSRTLYLRNKFDGMFHQTEIFIIRSNKRNSFNTDSFQRCEKHTNRFLYSWTIFYASALRFVLLLYSSHFRIQYIQVNSSSC